YRHSTVLNAQMSIRYNLAVAMIDGEALVGQFTPRRIADEDVNMLAQKVEVMVDSEMDAVYPQLYACIVTLKLNDGRSFTKRVDHSKGMPEAPMSAEEMSSKFLSLAGAAIGNGSAEHLLTALATAFSCEDMATLAEQIGAFEL